MLNRSLVDESLMVREAHHERLNFKFFRLKLVAANLLIMQAKKMRLMGAFFRIIPVGKRIKN